MGNIGVYEGECEECGNTFRVKASFEKLDFSTVGDEKFIRWRCRCGNIAVAEKRGSPS